VLPAGSQSWHSLQPLADVGVADKSPASTWKRANYAASPSSFSSCEECHCARKLRKGERDAGM